MKKVLLIVSAALTLGGCGGFTPREVAQPSQISVRQAVFEVADTLRDVQDRIPPEKRSGLIADEVTVVLNVAAGSTKTDSANLSISNVPLAAGALGASAATQNISNASRGNTITIKFKNIATADIKSGPPLGDRTKCPRGYALVRGFCIAPSMSVAPN